MLAVALAASAAATTLPLGSRDLAAIVKHVTTDTLVIWAWHPGRGRQPAPGSNAQFGELMQAWAGSGAACPAG